MITEIQGFHEMKIIDIHTHGVSGYDTRTAESDHILKIAAIHGSSGVSDILLAVYPSSLDMMRNQMETIKKAIERQKAGQDERKKTKKHLHAGHQASGVLNAGEKIRKDTRCPSRRAFCQPLKMRGA